MPQSAYGVIEMVFVYGVTLSFLVWELVKTRRGLKADRERAAQPSPPAPLPSGRGETPPPVENPLSPSGEGQG